MRREVFSLIEIRALRKTSLANIVGWCQDRDADFLYQWAGKGYEYPLTAQQIETRLANGAEIFEAVLDDNVVATIEIIAREEKGTALMGRYLLNPALAGQGLGTLVLKAFMADCERKLGIKKLQLFVFDFNLSAQKCYQKCGFVEAETVIRPNGWKAIRMEKTLGE
ncbi:MAG: GNAT family N-acetyltransferase [Clostridia bacterium]|nr:GNAT family N-acetyltransferase [Clostridia bacterium]